MSAATDSAQVETQIATMESNFSAAIAKWSGVGQTIEGWFGDNTAQQTLGNLNGQVRTQLNNWEARGRALAQGNPQPMAAGPNGLDSFDLWTSTGNDLVSLLTQIAGDAGYSSIGTIVSDTVSQSATDVKNDATAAVVAAGNAAESTLNGIDKLVQWLQKYGKTLAIVAGVVVLAGVGVYLWVTTAPARKALKVATGGGS
jgi:hypothetical protein